ncbi:repulsive guidance molecule A-like [Tachyglossus aculeatus]|uniref:repulsive guidance molecule A-like n=1 Tax=Tachyglossus aculeatus TaxID=9261 RepID=UPI0018F38076|nr:repulsive guidance molecule A-like [Tachyglossus aculeatus]
MDWSGERRRPPWWAMALLLCCLPPVPTVLCQQCQIQSCNAHFVAASSPSPALPEEVQPADDYCAALRAYAACTKGTAKSCRGDLVYHSAVFRIKELFGQHNCSSRGPTSSVSAPAPPDPLGSQICNYTSRPGTRSRFALCGLFGDPHLRTFKDEFQTCKVEGAWPLIDNRYLSVQVTNVPVVLGSSATATSKITLIFKRYQGCTEQKVYQATTEDLPLAFSDGTRNGGGRAEGASSLRILEKAPTGQVEIQARHIGGTIVIRRVGHYLTFAIRLPEETLGLAGSDGGDGGLQLCLHGCPKSELIQGHRLSLGNSSPAPRAFSAESATERCRRILRVEDVYFQSCVFDLLTTGDPDFSMAAYGALEDLRSLYPGPLQLHAASGTKGAPGEPGAAVLGTLALLLCCLWG